MINNSLKTISTVVIVISLNSCAAYHSGNMYSSASLSSANFSYVSQNIKGEATATYILGFGGLGKETLVNNAKLDMLTENPLKNNQALANLTVNFVKTRYLGLLMVTVQCIITADVVEFKAIQGFTLPNNATGSGEQPRVTDDGSLINYQGRSYGYKTIGTQIWMVGNLAYLPSVSPSAVGSESSPHYYVYNYQGTSVDDAKGTDNFRTYGVLYNYEAAKSVCPVGWHLPSNEEWTTLSVYLASAAGGKMKESETLHWSNPNVGATNASGFTALPGGYRNGSGGFSDLGNGAYFWSSTEDGTTNVWNRSLLTKYDGLFRIGSNRGAGYSVRCLRN